MSARRPREALTDSSSVPAVYTVLENALAVNKKGAIMDNWGSLTEHDAAYKLVKGHFALGDTGDRINYWSAFLQTVCTKREGVYAASQWPVVTQARDIFLHLELLDVVKEPLAVAFETIGHAGKAKGSVRAVLAGFESRLKVLKGLPPHLPVARHLRTAFEQLVELIFQQASTAHRDMLTAPLHSAARPDVFFDSSSGKAGRLLAWFDTKAAKLTETIEDSAVGLSDADMLLLYDGSRKAGVGLSGVASVVTATAIVPAARSGTTTSIPPHVHRCWGNLACVHGVRRLPNGFRFGTNTDVTVTNGTVPPGTCPAALAPGHTTLSKSSWCCTPGKCSFDDHAVIDSVETSSEPVSTPMPTGSGVVLKPTPALAKADFPMIPHADVPDWARQPIEGAAKSPRKGGRGRGKDQKGPVPTIRKGKGKGKGGSGGKGRGGKGFQGQQ